MRRELKVIVLKDQNDTQLITQRGNYIRQELYDELKRENEILKAKVDILTGKAILAKEKGAKEIKITKIKGE